MAIASPPQPPVLKRGGFQVIKGSFSAGGVQRVAGKHLKELFNPESLRRKRDRMFAREAAKSLFKKSFFAGQLRHYGIGFNANATPDSLRTLLEDSVEQGRCDGVPKFVLALEQRMKREYKPLHEKWNSEMSAYRAKKKRKRDEEFAKCTTAGERATCDLGRFMKHYFLTDGLPDELKAPKPLALHGFGETEKLQAKAEPIPGLHIHSGGSDVVCIGWDRDAVVSLASRVTAKAAKTQKKRTTNKWEESLEAHRQYVASQDSSSQGQRGRPAKRPSLQWSNLEKCVGSYVVQCNKISKGWDVRAGDLTLDICKDRDGVLIANLDFGAVEGTMLLSLSEEKLELIASREENDEASDPSTSESEASESDESDSNSSSDGKNGKRSARATTSTNRDQSTGPNAKKRKLTPTVSRRVHFRLRGRETGEGCIFSDPEPGYLDFLDDECTEFAGKIHSLPFLDTNVKFHGYKVSDKPQRKPESWSFFSEEGSDSDQMRKWF
ncbi:hypothetical protein AK830_g10566 [Neonectria ditissima]|uniref:Uncharacterized protein n=1 Tax=Neonectria ditissima TaxID=78410 RepID=A0A0P7BA87_9HYPO|nr:hypothetical protein AK830_g10566 [Neonectria ditissima]